MNKKDNHVHRFIVSIRSSDSLKLADLIGYIARSIRNDWQYLFSDDQPAKHYMDNPILIINSNRYSQKNLHIERILKHKFSDSLLSVADQWEQHKDNIPKFSRLDVIEQKNIQRNFYIGVLRGIELARRATQSLESTVLDNLEAECKELNSKVYNQTME